jgi:hypothetical protein
MTKFNKEDFTWDGMYLMYEGAYKGQPTMDEVYPNCHPSWVGKPKPAFIARFKYGRKPYKSWINFLCKNTSVENYLELSAESTPVQAMEQLGYQGK